MNVEQWNGKAPGGGNGYQIERSIRLNAPDSAYLGRTPLVAGNRKTWTWAGWVKKCAIARSGQTLLNAGTANNDRETLEFLSTDALRLINIGLYSATTAAVFRDISSWYHILVQVNTANATEADRVKFYVNGVRVAASVTCTLNSDSRINNSSYTHRIAGGYDLDSNYLLQGYLADIHFIDGQALDPSSFGEFDANGVWQPKAYTGTYGTNGFHLPFSDNSTAAALGTDISGNGNNWTVNNISVAAGAGNDSLVDTPTNYGVDDGLGGSVRGNYATLNPLDGSPGGLSNGNLDAASANAYPTIIPGSGQWYYEVNGTGYQWDGIRANWTPRAGSHNFGQRAWASSAPSGFKALCTTNLPEPQTITTSGSYTGNGVADGPFVYLNGVPTAMTVNGNTVTFGTYADKLSNGFKVRTTSTTYNQNAVVYNYSITNTGDPFNRARAQTNP